MPEINILTFKLLTLILSTDNLILLHVSKFIMKELDVTVEPEVGHVENNQLVKTREV